VGCVNGGRITRIGAIVKHSEPRRAGVRVAFQASIFQTTARRAWQRHVRYPRTPFEAATRVPIQLLAERGPNLTYCEVE